MPWPAGVPCLPWCLELWAGPCRESSEWLAGPNFTVRPRAHSTGSMGRIPLFSLSGPDNCWYTPSRGLPCWSLGHPHLVGPVGFGWRGACALFCCSQSPLQCPEPSAQDPVPARSPAMPCPVLPCLAMPCHALPCPGFPSPTWKVPARHCPVTRPSQSSRTRPPPSRPAVCLCLSSHHHHHTTTSFGLVARLLSFPGLTSPHPHLWLNSSGKSSEVSCLVLTVHSFNPFYLLDS